MRKIEQDRITAAANSKAAAMANARQAASKRFLTNQQARCWHLANHHPSAIGWNCNAYNSVHLYSEGGLNDCDEPAKGGCDYFGEIKRRKDGYCWVPKNSNL
jgi:hypothetical protein